MLQYFLFFMSTQTGGHTAVVPHLVAIPNALLPDDLGMIPHNGVSALADSAIAWHVAATCFGGEYTTDADDCGIEYDSGMIIAPARGEAPVFLGEAGVHNALINELKRSGMNVITLAEPVAGKLTLNEQAYVALSKEPVENAAKGLIVDAKQLWAKLGDTPVNDDGELEDAFLGFDPGVHREVIWYWFEDTFDLSVAKDLMFSEHH